ncbi:integrase, partial [Novosphingobium indicum]|uniref:integrase n=1 Tax=Novosphingobium indicum TaxID=462949 RepID=UPI0016668D41
MAKTLKEAPLTTRNARAGLAAGVHWRGVDPEVHLGYRKGKRGGVWLVRWRAGAGYRQEKIGTADDHIAEGTLAYGEAVKAAREKVVEVRRRAEAEAAGPVVTVRLAVETYIAERDAEDSKRAGRPMRSDAARRLERYVIGRPARGRRDEVAAAPIAQIPLYDLTVRNLTDWRADCGGLSETALRRLSNDFRAALNAAVERHGEALPGALPGIIKRGLKSKRLGDSDSTARENQILSDGEVGALIRAAREIDSEQDWEGDLFRLVTVMAGTGARFAQVVRLRVGDVGRDVQSGTPIISMPNSRKVSIGVQSGPPIGAQKGPLGSIA